MGFLASATRCGPVGPVACLNSLPPGKERGEILSSFERTPLRTSSTSAAGVTYFQEGSQQFNLSRQ